METVHWPQEIGLVRATEETAAMGAATGGSSGGGKAPEMTGVERRIGGRPQKEQARNCPRCNSNNTKFCYYNNYSLSQPRYFCKTCRRYWTEGGSLRNVPVGGGSRKNKRSSSSASAASTATTRPRLTSSSIESEGRDLNLGFHHPAGFPPELFSGDFAPAPAPQVVYPAGFVLQDFRSFQLDGGTRAAGEGGEGRFLFPSGDDQNRGQGGEPGFWNGMMGGGGSW